MKKVTFNIPDSLDLDDKEITVLVATSHYEHGKLSLGQEGKQPNWLDLLTKQTFAELLARYGVSIFNYPSSDRSRDVKNA